MWIFVWGNAPSKIFVGDTQVSKVFVWDTQVRPTGWWQWWTPTANTIWYYPLKSDFTDASGNGYDLTVSNASISTAGWVACAYYNSGRGYNSSAPVGNNRTMSAWVYNITTSGDPVVIGTWANQNSFAWMFLALGSGQVQISDFYTVWINWWTLSANAWHNIVAVNANSSMKIYIDWVLKNSTSHSQTISSTWVSVWGKPFVNQYNNDCTWYISEAIIEWAAWSDTDVSNYFNDQKSHYWIS